MLPEKKKAEPVVDEGEIMAFMKKHPRLKKMAKRYEKQIASIQKKLDGMPDPTAKK